MCYVASICTCTRFLNFHIPIVILDSAKEEMKEAELSEITMPPNGVRADPVYIRREKEQPPSLAAQKHPHGTAPSNGVHPSTGAPRAMTYGNDNSSVNRQSRVQGIRPDPIPGNKINPFYFALQATLSIFYR